MAAVSAQVFRFGPHEVAERTLAASFAAALAANSIPITSSNLKHFEKEIVRGEVVYTVLFW